MSEDDFTTPPPNLALVSASELSLVDPPETAAALLPTDSEAARADAVLELWHIQRTVLIGRAVAGGIASLAGIVIVIAVVCFAICSVNLAWDERAIFSDNGNAERLKYLIAFFSFKAAALGGALTAGMLLIRAGIRFSGAGDEKAGNESPPK